MAAAIGWRQRRDESPGQSRLLDTRYDAGRILACESQRLVDVCADLGLDVTQPDLRGISIVVHDKGVSDLETEAACSPPVSTAARAAVLETMNASAKPGHPPMTRCSTAATGSASIKPATATAPRS
jgi:hypothetical protein